MHERIISEAILRISEATLWASGATLWVSEAIPRISEAIPWINDCETGRSVNKRSDAGGRMDKKETRLIKSGLFRAGNDN